jgi:hypothetical protein
MLADRNRVRRERRAAFCVQNIASGRAKACNLAKFLAGPFDRLDF